MPFFWRFEEGDRGNDDGGEGKIEKKKGFRRTRKRCERVLGVFLTSDSDCGGG